MKQTKEKPIVIIGPTASGKSDAAKVVARKLNGEIISVDSRQIYRGLDIGSGKVRRDDKHLETAARETGSRFLEPYFSDRVAHYLISVYHPRTIVGAAQFLTRARRVRSDIARRGKRVIIAGGTLFWAQALVEEQIFPAAAPDEKLRRQLSRLSAEELLRTLRRENPALAANFTGRDESRNRYRLVRAIEISRAGGDRASAPETGKNPAEVVAILPPKDILARRIETRLEEWIKEGFWQEIFTLRKDFALSRRRLESFGMEYRWGARFLAGECSLREMKERSIREIRRYAKRQMTWIRRWQRQGRKMTVVSSPEEATAALLEKIDPK